MELDSHLYLEVFMEQVILLFNSLFLIQLQPKVEYHMCHRHASYELWNHYLTNTSQYIKSEMRKEPKLAPHM